MHKIVINGFIYEARGSVLDFGKMSDEEKKAMIARRGGGRVEYNSTGLRDRGVVDVSPEKFVDMGKATSDESLYTPTDTDTPEESKSKGEIRRANTMVENFLRLSEHWLNKNAFTLARRYSEANADEWYSMLATGIWIAISRDAKKKAKLAREEAKKVEQSAEDVDGVKNTVVDDDDDVDIGGDELSAGDLKVLGSSDEANPDLVAKAESGSIPLTVPLVYFQAKMEGLREYNVRYRTKAAKASSVEQALESEEPKWPIWLSTVISKAMALATSKNTGVGSIDANTMAKANKAIASTLGNKANASTRILETLKDSELRTRFTSYYTESFIPAIAQSVSSKTGVDAEEWAKYFTSVVEKEMAKVKKVGNAYKNVSRGVASLDAPAPGSEPGEGSGIDAVSNSPTPEETALTNSNIQELMKTLPEIDYLILEMKKNKLSSDKIAAILKRDFDYQIEGPTVDAKLKKMFDTHSDLFRRLAGGEFVEEELSKLQNNGGKSAKGTSLLKKLAEGADALMESQGFRYYFIESETNRVILF